MAKVKELRIAMSRKISDDNYGSLGVQGEIFLVLDEDDDKDEMWAYGTSWLSTKLTGTHKAHGTQSSQPAVPAGAVLKEAPKAKTGPAPVIAPDEDVFDVTSISIEMMPDGTTKTAKAKGDIVHQTLSIEARIERR